MSTEQGGQVETGGSDTQARDYEAEARDMGWVPQDDFHEAPEKWINAEEFVKRGENILPILRANNKKLRQESLTKDAAIATLQQSLANQGKAIKALQKGYSESTRKEVEAAKTALLEQLKAAKTAGDVDTEVEVQERLTELRDADRAAKKKDAEEETPQGSEKLSKVFAEWNTQNPWFGDTSNLENRQKTRAIIKIGEELRAKGELSVGFEFMDKCVDLLTKQEKASPKATSKVEGSAGGRTAAKTGRAFDRLPKEAKETCHVDNDSFVGPGKMFKTIAEWEDHYASLYGED